MTTFDPQSLPLSPPVRCLAAFLTACGLVLVVGPAAIAWLKNRYHERILSDSPRLNQLHASKQGTPTMGGVLVIAAFLISLAAWGDLTSRFNQVCILVAVSMTVLGAADDLIKFNKAVKGLSARSKLAVQILISLPAALILVQSTSFQTERPHLNGIIELLPALEGSAATVWILTAWVIFLIVGASNSVNLTDGMDGLACGCTLTTLVPLIVAALAAVPASVSVVTPSVPLPAPAHDDNLQAAIMLSALAGSLAGFLWFNCYPARIFLGDAGSLPIGALIAVAAAAIHQEFLLALAGGVLVMETVSVVIQVVAFRLTGRRVFRCSPLHHHFQFRGDPEPRIVLRFWLYSLIFSLTAVAVALTSTSVEQP